MSSTKELVLQTLISTSNDFISGQELAKKCGISRTAIWKAVNSLVNEGYEIEAVTNRGYRIKKIGNNLTESQLQAFVPKDLNISFKVFEELDSTILECKRLCAATPNLYNSDETLTEQGKKLNFHVVLAEKQTAGRGRLGRTFYSPAKNGIYFSMIYIPEHSVIQPAKMTATAAVAVCNAIKKVFNLETKIKWVNDIFFNGKKICGILTEGITNFETGKIEAAIIGIGINISQPDSGFPKEIADVAGSLLKNPPESIKRNELAAQLAVELARMYIALEKSTLTKAPALTNTSTLDNSSASQSAPINSIESEADASAYNAKKIMQEYKNRTFLIGKTVEVSPVIDGNEKYTATVLDITDDAALVVQKTDGSKITLQSGEVSLLSKNFSF